MPFRMPGARVPRNGSRECGLVSRLGVEQPAWSRAVPAQVIVGVHQGALLERQATTADALGETIPHPFEPLDSGVELGAPAFRGSDPEVVARGDTVGEGGKHLTDHRERNAEVMRGTDERDLTKRRPVVASLVS